MTVIHLFGASDDLIEIEGSLDGEINIPRGDFFVITFSNGAAIQVDYSILRPGLWTLRPIYMPVGTSYKTLFEAEFADDVQYSDIAEITSEEPITGYDIEGYSKGVYLTLVYHISKDAAAT